MTSEDIKHQLIIITLIVQELCESRGGRPGLSILKPVLNWANVCSPEHTSDTSTNYDSFLNWTFSSPNMVRTVQTLLYSQLACNEMQASARTFGRQLDRKCRLSQVKSVYFNHPSQGNSTNYYLILGLRDKAAPSTSQQINKFPLKRVKNLATSSSIFIFVFSPFTGELFSQPIRGNDRPIGQMFPEHVERRFLDPEYSFDEYFQLGSRRKVGPIKNQLASPNTSN